jgi:hypothetical protein
LRSYAGGLLQELKRQATLRRSLAATNGISYPLEVVVPWHYREGAWPGFERTLTVDNWARGRGIPMTKSAPYRDNALYFKYKG